MKYPTTLINNELQSYQQPQFTATTLRFLRTLLELI